MIFLSRICVSHLNCLTQKLSRSILFETNFPSYNLEYSNLIIYIALRKTSHEVFDRLQFSKLYAVFFSIAKASLAKCGAHTGHAYSKIGLTNDLYNMEKISLFLPPICAFPIMR